MTRTRTGSAFGPHTVLGQLGMSRGLPSGDRGSLALAMMISTVGMMLAGLVLPAVILQIKSTKNSADRVRALHAAQSGLDAALAEIRAANDGNGNGLKSKLPCGPIVGTTSVAAASRYSTDIYYFGVDPQSHADDATWINDPTHRITCNAGSGTPTVPAFALLKSRGTDYAAGTIASAKGRTLRATYPLQTTIGNIAGGQIHNDAFGTAQDLCLDAGSGSPNPNSKPTMDTCVTGDPGQQWAYTPKLNLVLVASKTATKPDGMCLDAQYPHNFPGTVPLVINNCSNPVTERQQWSYSNDSAFHGNYNGALDNYCFAPANQASPGNQLNFGTSNCNTANAALRPAAQVGAGAAGLSTKQWVNFSQFGRCMDASLQNGVTAPAVPTHVLAWPCKQAPSAAGLGWNEVWTFPALTDDPNGVQGRIKSTDSAHSDVWCLQSALVPGIKVTLADCSGSLPATVVNRVLWTVFRDTGTFSTSYRIQDSAGYCLQPDPDRLEDPSSDLYTEVCSDATIQKWNAPPMLQSEPLKDLGEN